MAEASRQDGGNTAVPHEGDHDRVVMLSLKADGTPDQHNPEVIGDRDFVKAAAKRQFAEQAVSAVDVTERGVSAGPVTLVGQKDGSVKEEPLRSEPDPATAELKKKHDETAKAAESVAERTVESLVKDKVR